jgi:UDP-glucose 6-dehydrogenase
LLLAHELASRGVPVVAFDPQGHAQAANALGNRVHLSSSVEECIAKSGVTVLATPWPQFLSLPAERWVREGSPRVVIDCWRALRHLEFAKGIRYMGLGNGPVRENIIEKSIADRVVAP